MGASRYVRGSGVLNVLLEILYVCGALAALLVLMILVEVMKWVSAQSRMAVAEATLTEAQMRVELERLFSDGTGR